MVYVTSPTVFCVVEIVPLEGRPLELKSPPVIEQGDALELHVIAAFAPIHRIKRVSRFTNGAEPYQYTRTEVVT
jgi:hypothetical protein